MKTLVFAAVILAVLFALEWYAAAVITGLSILAVYLVMCEASRDMDALCEFWPTRDDEVGER